MVDDNSTLFRKMCTKCGERKLLSDFYRQKNNKDGRAGACKPCYIERVTAWKNANPDKVAANNRRWSKIHRQEENARKNEFSKRYIKLSPEYRDRRRKAARVEKRKRRADPSYRAFDNVRRAVLYALRDGKKYTRTFELLGYTRECLAKHIEKQFEPGMTWENYGQWHIDHIIPASSFSFADHNDPELRACWALSNLRPLWAKENLSKKEKITHLI